MTTEKELKDKVTPDIINKMVELAEGFELWSSGSFAFNPHNRWNGYIKIDLPDDRAYFPFLIYRAVEGWNKKETDYNQISIMARRIVYWSKKYDYKNYQPENLTQLELALPHCLIVIFKEGKLEVV